MADHDHFDWEQLIAYLVVRDNQRRADDQEREEEDIEDDAYDMESDGIVLKCPEHTGYYVSTATWQ